MRFRSLLAALLAAGVFASCGDNEPPTGSAAPRAGPEHIHGLGVNPSDGALMIATHRGLFRAAPNERSARRVGDRHQDTMGFTVVGPDRFLGSGHPDARDDLPPLLGLIRSDDAGRSWEPVSLLGEADFHVLRAAGSRLYGYDSTQGRLLVSDDGGRRWAQRRPPAALVDLAVTADDPDTVIASTESGLYRSRDAGATWRALNQDRAGVLALTDGLVVVDGAGAVWHSPDGGARFERIGDAGGAPAAIAAAGRELYLALHDNTVKQSADGGRTWVVRVAP